MHRVGQHNDIVRTRVLLDILARFNLSHKLVSLALIVYRHAWPQPPGRSDALIQTCSQFNTTKLKYR